MRVVVVSAVLNRERARGWVSLRVGAEQNGQTKSSSETERISLRVVAGQSLMYGERERAQ